MIVYHATAIERYCFSVKAENAASRMYVCMHVCLHTPVYVCMFECGCKESREEKEESRALVSHTRVFLSAIINNSMDRWR